MKVHRYSVPNTESREGWAILFLDDAGCFACLSDFGDYNHRWNVKHGLDGEDLRRFLLGCDKSYLLGKLAPQKEFDAPRTLQAIKDYIAQHKEHWDDDKYHKELELITSPSIESELDYADWTRETSIDDSWDFSCTSYSAQAVAFMERAWPRLKEKIKEDLSQEAGPLSTSDSKPLPSTSS